MHTCILSPLVMLVVNSFFSLQQTIYRVVFLTQSQMFQMYCMDDKEFVSAKFAAIEFMIMKPYLC